MNSAVKGATLEESMKALKESKLLPESADFNDLLNTLDLEKSKHKKLAQFTPAVRDPQTGKIYTGPHHPDIIAAVKDPEVKKRLQAAFDENAGDIGFTDGAGNLISRSEAQKKYGFATSEELDAMRGEGMATAAESMKLNLESSNA